jgi:hypothetical protein
MNSFGNSARTMSLSNHTWFRHSQRICRCYATEHVISCSRPESLIQSHRRHTVSAVSGETCVSTSFLADESNPHELVSAVCSSTTINWHIIAGHYARNHAHQRLRQLSKSQYAQARLTFPLTRKHSRIALAHHSSDLPGCPFPTPPG